MAEAVREPTRFAPVVLAGLISAVLLAVTSAKDWVELDLSAGARVGFTDQDLRADSPLALSLSLVVLAAWGVVLVSRRRARMVVLVLAVLADLGVLACVLRAPGTLPDQIRTNLSLGHAGSATTTTAYWLALVAGIVCLVALGAGVRLVPRWPEMSSRYDAPEAGTAADVPAEDLADREFWKALDEGRDPTES
jgi:uncharacterized membrane protein (TIGR02234 family)